MSEVTKIPVPLCQDCMHVDMSGDSNPKFWRCKRATSPEYRDLALVVSLEQRKDISPYGFCVPERKYDLDNGCGPQGKWFEPAEGML